MDGMARELPGVPASITACKDECEIMMSDS